jgi:hypothetical protein
VRSVHRGKFSADEHCWTPYWNINEKLEEAVDELADAVEDALLDPTGTSEPKDAATNGSGAEERPELRRRPVTVTPD